MKMRTPLQQKCDLLDRNLHAIIQSTEEIYDTHKRTNPAARDHLIETLQALRKGRVGLRALMHKDDRERTK